MSVPKSVSIKREKFRGKYYVTLREDGKIVNRRAWSWRGFNNRAGNVQYKSTNSLYRSVERTHLSNVTETVDFRRTPKGVSLAKKPRGSFQYFVRAVVQGETVVARSMIHSGDYLKKYAVEEAYNNFYRRVAQLYGRGYDEDVGEELMTNFKGNIDEGFVYYR